MCAVWHSSFHLFVLEMTVYPAYSFFFFSVSNSQHSGGSITRQSVRGVLHYQLHFFFSELFLVTKHERLRIIC